MTESIYVMRNTISKQLNSSSRKFSGGISKWGQFFSGICLHQSDVQSLDSPSWKNDSSATTCWKGEFPERSLERVFHFNTTPVRKTKSTKTTKLISTKREGCVENHTEKMWRDEDKEKVQNFGWRRGENVGKGGMGTGRRVTKGDDVN